MTSFHTRASVKLFNWFETKILDTKEKKTLKEFNNLYDGWIPEVMFRSSNLVQFRRVSCSLGVEFLRLLALAERWPPQAGVADDTEVRNTVTQFPPGGARRSAC